MLDAGIQDRRRDCVRSLARPSVPFLDVGGIPRAMGSVCWVWDSGAIELRPALAHGYSDRVLAQLPNVSRDADNLTAEAFRTRQTCSIEGVDDDSSALVVPLLSPGGCGGVLAIEL